MQNDRTGSGDGGREWDKKVDGEIKKKKNKVQLLQYFFTSKGLHVLNSHFDMKCEEPEI